MRRSISCIWCAPDSARIVFHWSTAIKGSNTKRFYDLPFDPHDEPGTGLIQAWRLCLNNRGVNVGITEGRGLETDLKWHFWVVLNVNYFVMDHRAIWIGFPCSYRTSRPTWRTDERWRVCSWPITRHDSNETRTRKETERGCVVDLGAACTRSVQLV